MIVAAYELGRRSRLAGVPRDANPYKVPAGTPGGAELGLHARCEEAWDNGWDGAEAVREAI